MRLKRGEGIQGVTQKKKASSPMDHYLSFS